MKRHGLKSDQTVDFIRAYEADVLETTGKLLAREPRK